MGEKEDMKDKISDAALFLFNRDGSHRITTNHIISYLGISPGTFYYHFRNKEEIVRNIFSRITADFYAAFEPAFGSDSIEKMVEILRDVFSLYNRYSFFYNEISSLIDRDGKLGSDYIENYRLKTSMIKSLFAALEKKGIIVNGFSASGEADSVAEMLWILSDFRMTFLKTTGQCCDDSSVTGGYRNYLLALLPYLTEKAAGTAEACIRQEKG